MLRGDIIRLHHDTAIAGHPGHYKTLELVSRNYYWPGMSRDVRQYVEACSACQRTKPRRTLLHAPLQPHAIPPHPWHTISVDLIGPLPVSNMHNAVCVVVDRYSKQMHAIPTTTSLTAEGMAKLFRDHVFRLHGVLQKIIHDRGPQFQSKFMVDFYALLGIENNPSTAYHPQTDGQTERINQELEQYLRLFVNHHQDDWTDWLSIAEFSYNNRVHVSTGHSPFYLMHGYHPATGTTPNVTVHNETAQEFVDRMSPHSY